MKKKTPTVKTDAEAERFVATADLSKYDLSGLCLRSGTDMVKTGRGRS